MLAASSYSMRPPNVFGVAQIDDIMLRSELAEVVRWRVRGRCPQGDAERDRGLEVATARPTWPRRGSWRARICS